MLSKIVVLLCFCFALASSSAVRAPDGLRSLKNHADEARSVLSTIPERCATDSYLIDTEYVKSLHSIFNCSYSEVINGAANIALETGAYVAMEYKVITKLIVKFTSCAAEVNPLKIVTCDYREFVDAYSEIEGMVVSTVNFISDMRSMIIPLKAEIDNCLKLSATEYKMFLNNLILKARTCEKN